MGTLKAMAAVEVTLTSKDDREFKIDARVAIMSETVKSMMGVEDPDDIDPPEAAIPLPAVDGAILEQVIKYCQYHHDNKETKEEEKNQGTPSSSKLTTTPCSPSFWPLTTSTSRPS